jgi:hypothetical protein
LDYLITYLPVMPSPVSSIAIPDQIEGSLHIASNTRANAPDGCAQWTGTVTYEAGDTIHVLTTGGAYQAFLTKDGFGVYLPENETPTDVIIGNANDQHRYQIT